MGRYGEIWGGCVRGAIVGGMHQDGPIIKVLWLPQLIDNRLRPDLARARTTQSLSEARSSKAGGLVFQRRAVAKPVGWCFRGAQ